MNIITAIAMTGIAAITTNAIVHRTLSDIAAPQINIASKLNMLPIFSPVAFW
jgi:hypothetical protein